MAVTKPLRYCIASYYDAGAKQTTCYADRAELAACDVATLQKMREQYVAGFTPVFEPAEAEALSRLAEELDDDAITPSVLHQLNITEELLYESVKPSIHREAITTKDGKVVVYSPVGMWRCLEMIETVQGASRDMEIILVKRVKTLFKQTKVWRHNDLWEPLLDKMCGLAGMRLKDLLEGGGNDERIGLWFDLAGILL